MRLNAPPRLTPWRWFILRRRRGAVGTATGHHRHAASGLLYRDTNDFAVFFHVHGGGFTGRAHDADAVGAFGNVPVDQFAQAGVVDATVVVHRGDKGDDAAFQGDCR